MRNQSQDQEVKSVTSIPVFDVKRVSDNTEFDADVKVFNVKKWGGRHNTVLVVDDQVTGRKILTELLQQIDPSLNVKCYSDPIEALEAARGGEAPDLILTDYKMPGMDGVEFTNRVRSIKNCVDVPLVVITVCDDLNIRYKALDAGATDFITRPIDQYECQARFRNLLTIRRQQQIIKHRASWLEEQVALATQQIRVREKETLMRLAKAGEYRNEETGTHVLRMAKFSRLIAEELGMKGAYCQEIELAAPMHDIGKIGIPDHVLLKNSRLSDEEFTVMKAHTIIGYEILKGSPSKFMQLGAVIALNHHEKYDGSGYPYGLRGEEIPLAARIVAVADVFDALTSKRPYKEPWDFVTTIEYLKAQTGRHLDPDCVNVFVKKQDVIKSIQCEFENITNAFIKPRII